MIDPGRVQLSLENIAAALAVIFDAPSPIARTVMVAEEREIARDRAA